MAHKSNVEQHHQNQNSKDDPNEGIHCQDPTASIEQACVREVFVPPQPSPRWLNASRSVLSCLMKAPERVAPEDQNQHRSWKYDSTGEGIRRQAWGLQLGLCRPTDRG